MERCLYNNIIGSISLSGDRFYYANPLAVLPSDYEQLNDPRPQVTVLRQPWFDVACCPPNLARLLMSLGGYIYLRREKVMYVNLFIGSQTKFEQNGVEISFQLNTKYPKDGEISITLTAAQPVYLSLGLRLPHWSKQVYQLLEGEKPVSHHLTDGYIMVDRVWEGETQMTLILDMSPRVTEADARIVADCGRVALERGPLVYCFEEYDNGAGLQDLRIDPHSVHEEPYDSSLLGGIIALHVNAWRRKPPKIDNQTLYRQWESDLEEVSLRAIPFYARYNRSGGEMAVWMLNRDR